MSQHWFLKLIPLFALAVSACGNGVPAASSAPSTAETPALQYTPTLTPLPTPTSLPGLVWLIAPPETSFAQAVELESTLSELSVQSGFIFEKRASLAAGEITDAVRVVVALPPDPGLADLAAAYPRTQFLAVAIPGLQAAGKLSVIGAQGDRPDQQGFLAGYLAAVISKDWRVGVISRGDNPAGQAARLAFVNGVVFFCGLCRPAYPPFYQYPVFAEISLETSFAQQQAAADILIGSAVKTVYVFPYAGDAALLEYLAQAGLNLISGGAPPAGLESRWVASIQTDPISALRQLWPNLLSGAGGLSLELPLALTHANSELFSPGRQQLVAKTLADLLAGYIGTGVDPLTGQPR